MTTAVLLTATVTMESRARIGNRFTPSQKEKEGKEVIAVFSNIQVALRWTVDVFAKARVEIQMSLPYFHFWNNITL